MSGPGASGPPGSPGAPGAPGGSDPPARGGDVCPEPGAAPTCPVRRLVSPRRRLLPPSHIYPVEPWRLVETRFTPRFLPQTESFFAVSNGYLGIRGSFEEGAPTHDAGTFLNGFYESWPIVYGEEAHGFAKTGQTMLHVPDGTIVKLYVDDEPFQMDRVRVLSFRRALELASGTLYRSVHFETADRRRLVVRSRRMASLVHRHLACLVYEVTAERGSASITLSSELVTPGLRQQSEGGDPRRARAFEQRPLVPVDSRTRDWRLLFSCETQASRLRMACAMDHELETDCPYEVEPSECADDRGRVVFHAEVAEGCSLRLVKYLAYHHDAEADHGELRFRTHRTLDRARREGQRRIFADQRQRVQDFWADADVEIEGDPEVQQAVRFNLFQILQATARSEGHGVPAKGLTGLGYEGHYFWDTEIYVLPFLTYTMPHVARSLLDHRVAMLPQARGRAREVGQRGALFPWRTINGEEASAYYAAGTAQYHINADVVYAGSRFVSITGDVELWARGLAEIAVETARLWSDLGFFSERKGGRFVINGVTGPDEYNTVVNNNTYTNLMARENLRYAVTAVETLRKEAREAYARLVAATGLAPDELDEWRRAADAMYVAYDEKAGVHLQDDIFPDKEPWDFAATPPDHYPLLLHYHPLVIYRHQVIKQADLVLAVFLLGHHFTFEEKRRIFDRYDPLTTGDSSLSVSIQGIVASELGYDEKAFLYFADAVVMDLGDIGGNVRDGLHVASLGGTWMGLVYGFAGLRDYGGRLRFHPRLPNGWERMRFRLRAHGARLEVDLRQEQVVYRLVEGARLELDHAGEPLTVTAEAPVTRPPPAGPPKHGVDPSEGETGAPDAAR